jgi:hypothetical protein
LREIVEEPEFVAARTELFDSAEEADRALFGATWALARAKNLSDYPSIGETPQGVVRAFKSRALPSLPSIVVYFTVSTDDQQINLHDVCGAIPLDDSAEE